MRSARTLARLSDVDRIVRIYPSHREADDAERAELAAMTPQDRLDRALSLQARYRESFGAAGQGIARIVRIVPFDRA